MMFGMNSQGNNIEFSSGDGFWASRSAIWAGRAEIDTAKIQKLVRPSSLALAGHGISMRIENGALVINGGLTHFPQTRTTYRFFRGAPEIPERIIVVDGTGGISFDVLSWLAEQDVSLVRLDWRGNVVCVAAKSGYSANPFRVKWQRETRENPQARIAFSVGLITAKIENSITTLEKSYLKNANWNKAMEAAYSALTKLDNEPPATVKDLRIIEANAAGAYFRAWKGVPLKWRRSRRNAIPENWREIGSRTTIFYRAGNLNAHHPVNAILNYAYTVLQSELQINAVAEGYDPTAGIMHEGGNGAAAFIFDLIEPLRARLDRAIFDFVLQTTLDPADFVIRSDGVCRLNPELARVITGIVSSQSLAGDWAPFPSGR